LLLSQSALVLQQSYGPSGLTVSSLTSWGKAVAS
jgi:hypothetical protein